MLITAFREALRLAPFRLDEAGSPEVAEGLEVWVPRPSQLHVAKRGAEHGAICAALVRIAER